MECPTCFQKIIAPQAPATDDPKFILTGIKVGDRPPPTVPGGVSAPVPAQKGFPGAAVVLIILIAIGVAVAFVYRGTFVKPTPWTLNLGAATIPDSTAAGRIHGEHFTCEHAVLEGNALTLRQGGRGAPELGVAVFLRGNRNENWAGQIVSVAADKNNGPHVRLHWKNESEPAGTQVFKTGYALRIEFGQRSDNRLPGKIYLCVPDELKSYVMGTFKAEIRKPRPPKQKK
jgi:hypothetical protein